MTSCLIFIEKKEVFVQFDRIIPTGLIEVNNLKGEVVIRQPINNSNYEQLNLENHCGRFLIMICLENETIKRNINI